MSLVTTIDIFCDRCGQWVHGSCGNKREAKRRAKSLGWKTQKDKFGKLMDICPPCHTGKPTYTFQKNIYG